MKTAVFAGGCFWCMVPPFRETDGVLGVVSGYTGGTTANPDYLAVSHGDTGHVEAVQIRYDPLEISYAELLEIYWRQIDPFDDHGQFADKGTQYRPVIYYSDEKERKLAEKSFAALEKQFGKKPLVALEPLSEFFEAETHHQDYDKKHPFQYQMYKRLSGRKGYLEKVWGKQSKHSH